MKNVCIGLLLAAAALKIFAAPSSVFAPAAAMKARPMTAEQRAERAFLKEAAAASRFDTEASRLALAKSSDPGVRALAVTFLNHHATAGLELQRMLHARGMALPMLGNDQRKVLNRLGRLQGGKFDREYLHEVGLKNQQDDVASFERAQWLVKEPVLSNWIGRNLPTMRYHLTRAEKIAPAQTRMAQDSTRAQRVARVAPVAHAVAKPAARPSQPVVAPVVATRAMGAGPRPVRALFDDQPDAQMGAPGARASGVMQLGVAEVPLTQMGLKHPPPTR